MMKLAGAILAMLLAAQAGVPSLGLEPPLSNFLSFGLTVLVAGVAVMVPSPLQRS